MLLEDLRGKQKVYAESGVSENTKRTRKQQILRYKKFCKLFSLVAFPCSAPQASLYATYLADKLKPVSIKNYLSAVWFTQKLLGYPDYSSNFVLKKTLDGIERKNFVNSEGRYPLSPLDMLRIYSLLDMSIEVDKVFWLSIVIAYRCILRICHVTKNVHCLKVKHVSLTEEYVRIHIASSKTDQLGRKPHDVFLKRLDNSPLCPGKLLEEMFKRPWATPNSNVFRIGTGKSLYTQEYAYVNTRLKSLAVILNLPVQRVSSHSLRHGGATMLKDLGMCVDNIKQIGNWRSNVVNVYLHKSESELLSLDVLPAEFLANLKI